MGGLESDTIGGFNSMMDKQRKEPGKALITTVLFDNKYEVIHDRFPMERVGAEWKQEIREDYAKREKLKFWKKR